MKQGWSRVLIVSGSYTKKFHYFVDGRSLCNKYMKFTDEGLDDTLDISKDNCSACQKKKIKVPKLPKEPIQSTHKRQYWPGSIGAF